MLVVSQHTPRRANAHSPCGPRETGGHDMQRDWTERLALLQGGFAVVTGL